MKLEESTVKALTDEELNNLLEISLIVAKLGDLKDSLVKEAEERVKRK